MSPVVRGRVAFQGTWGAFSHEACRHHLPDAEPAPFATFEEAFGAVHGGDCPWAFLPVENSIAGPVPEVARLLPSSGLAVMAEHLWPIRMQLMANPGARLDAVSTVASHPMALKQGGRFLRERSLDAEAAFDTAGAAAELAGRPDPTRAVIAPRTAAKLYRLTILAEDVQDRADNVTRFLLLGAQGAEVQATGAAGSRHPQDRT